MESSSLVARCHPVYLLHTGLAPKLRLTNQRRATALDVLHDCAEAWTETLFFLYVGASALNEFRLRRFFGKLRTNAQRNASSGSTILFQRFNA